MIYSFHNQRWCMNIRSEMFSIDRTEFRTRHARQLAGKTNERDEEMSFLAYFRKTRLSDQ